MLILLWKWSQREIPRKHNNLSCAWLAKTMLKISSGQKDRTNKFLKYENEFRITSASYLKIVTKYTKTIYLKQPHQIT